MGADVIKVEGRDGDPVRFSGTPAIGAPDGPGLLHLRWNRGKRSLGLNLKSEAGVALFASSSRRPTSLSRGCAPVCWTASASASRRCAR